MPIPTSSNKAIAIVREGGVPEELRSQLVACVREFVDAKGPPEPVDIGSALETAGLQETGDLSEVPIPELLDQLHHAGETGVLIVEGPKGRARGRKQRVGVQLRNGSPIAVSVAMGSESFEDFLVRTERISSADDHGDPIFTRWYALSVSTAATVVGQRSPRRSSP